MKKRALFTAIAAAMASNGAHAVVATGASAANAMPITTVPCSSTWSGGRSEVSVTTSSAVGTICFYPTNSPAAPYIMLKISLTNSAPASGSGTVMDGGMIMVLTDWGTASGWSPYSVINASITPINCPGLNGVLLPGASTVACIPTVIGSPTNLYWW